MPLSGPLYYALQVLFTLALARIISSVYIQGHLYGEVMAVPYTSGFLFRFAVFFPSLIGMVSQDPNWKIPIRFDFFFEAFPYPEGTYSLWSKNYKSPLQLSQERIGIHPGIWFSNWC